MKNRNKKGMKIITAVFFMLALLVCFCMGHERNVYASGGEEEETKRELVVNGVDFSNIDFADFKLSDLSDEQWMTVKNIISIYGLDSSSLSFQEDFFERAGDEPETADVFSDYHFTGEEPTRAEKKGTGSTGTAIVTSNDLEGAMEFVKITTKDDQMFFLVIDYTQEEDNVYFLDIVSVNDLFRIAENGTDADENPIYVDYSQFRDKNVLESKDEKETDDEKDTEKETESSPKAPASEEKTQKNSSMMQNVVLLLGIAVIGGAAFVFLYFTKIKNKKIDEDEDDFEDMIDDEEGSDDAIFGNVSSDRESPFDIELADEPDEAENGETGELPDMDLVNESDFVRDDETDNSDF